MPEPATRLYLILPRLTDSAAFRPLLISALDAGDIACVLLRQGDARVLMPVVQERDVAFLIEGEARAAARIGADGIHLSYSPEQLENAVSSLGPDAIVGVGGITSRDDAMNAGEAGASYVMFGEPSSEGIRPPADQTLERVTWWADIFNVPCVGYAGTLDEIGPLAEAGAEFIALGEAVWDHPTGPAEAVRQASTILANAVLTA